MQTLGIIKNQTQTTEIKSSQSTTAHEVSEPFFNILLFNDRKTFIENITQYFHELHCNGIYIKIKSYKPQRNSPLPTVMDEINHLMVKLSDYIQRQ